MNYSRTIVLTLAMAVSSLSGMSQAAPFQVESPAIRGASVNGSGGDDKAGCMCELVKGQWKCIPVGCVPQFSGHGSLDLRRQSIERNSLPGDQFQRTPSAPVEGAFQGRR